MPTERLSMRRITAVADDALRCRGEHAGDRAGAGHRTEHGAGVSGPGDSGGDRLAAGRGCHRREPGGTAVRQCRRACRGALPRRARLGGVGARAQATRRQPDGSVGRISRGPPGGLRLQPVLPVVPRVRAAAVADDAPAARGRRQSCSSTTPASGCRSSIRATGEVRVAEIFVAVLGASNLHLCRGDLDADVAGLDRRPCAHVPLLWGGAASAGAGQSQERHQQGLVLRSGGEPQLCGDGGALRRRRPASPAETPAR